MKDTSRGFAHILLILVVLVGVGALGYYMLIKSNLIEHSNHPIDTVISPKPYIPPSSLSSSPIPTQKEDLYANWKIYTNKTSDYSFAYLPEWTVSSKLPSNLIEYVALFDPSLSDAASPVFAVQLSANSYDKQSKMIKAAIGATTEEDFTLSTKQGKQYVSDEGKGPGPQFIAYVFPLDNKSVVILYTPKQEDKDYTTTMHRILSSFRFIN